MRLFCFPYAGGSAMYYYNWKNYLDESFELIPVEYAGRGRRIEEPLNMHLIELVDDLFNKLAVLMNQDKQYALYGHSMGAKVAFALCQKIASMNIQPPVHVFCSGSGSPYMRIRDRLLHDLDDIEFKHEILAMGGTTTEFFAQKELLQFYMPILKNDLKLAESNLGFTDFRLNCNITVMNGNEDKITIAQIIGWQQTTTGKCIFYNFKGRHFFINDQKKEVIGIINKTLLSNN